MVKLDSFPLERGYALENAVLVGLILKNATAWQADETMAELEELAKTAGARVSHVALQKRDSPDSSLYIGKGKAEEIRLLVEESRADMVIFDAELSPTQGRNLEEALGCKVVDRTALILDIFATRARTREGKLQVELAQLNYLLPRLTGRGTAMSRLGGGIGTRGPGETKLEMDRRRIRRRIANLNRDIENIKKHRMVQRQSRKKNRVPTVALVGYTNAGKSTLFNAVTQAETFTEDRLFATLDPLLRRARLPGGQEIILADTVGFIRKLPHFLVASFRATLEEVKEADLLLNVIDINHPAMEEHMASVLTVLNEIHGKEPYEHLAVFNKRDLLEEEGRLARLKREYPESVMISALKRTGLKELLVLVEDKLKLMDLRRGSP